MNPLGVAVAVLCVVAAVSATGLLASGEDTGKPEGSAPRTTVVYDACLKTREHAQHQSKAAFQAFCECYAEEMVSRLEPREQDVIIAGLAGQGAEAVASHVNGMSQGEQVRFTERTREFIAATASRCTEAAETAARDAGRPSL